MLSALFVVGGLWPQYHRMEYEAETAAENANNERKIQDATTVSAVNERNGRGNRKGRDSDAVTTDMSPQAAAPLVVVEGGDEEVEEGETAA